MAANRRKKREKGFVLLVTTASMLLVLPTVGLAIDAGFLYAVRARLSAAADAGALAAARSLSKGLTLAEQEQSARARARAFFDANFPDGFLNTKNKVVGIEVAETAFRTRTVYVNAQVDANLYFMRTLGFDETPIAVEGKASRRDVNLIVVLDRSGSMQSAGACEPMKEASKAFVKQFANGRDRLGMVTFSTNVNLDFAPSMNFKPGIEDKINNISCSGFTNSASALWRAYEELQNINEPGTLNLILFFTDGQPTALTAAFPIKRVSDNRYEIRNGWDATVNTEPSPCKDREGDRYDRNAGAGERQYWAPNWNPNWDAEPTTITGVMRAPQAGFFKNYGDTEGLFSLSTGSRLSTGRSCAFDTYDYREDNLRRDFAYIPDRDTHGSRTRGGASYIPIESSMKFPSGHPYEGKLRIDLPKALAAASKNAAHNAAYNIRDDSTLRPVIYSIGLGDPANPIYAPDPEFLQRIANDPESPGFVEAHQTGLFVFAPDKTELAQAFYRVASEILRISQ